MRALAIVHQPDAGPGVFAEAARSGGVELESWTPAEAAGPPRALGDYAAVLAFGGAMHADQTAAHPWLAAEKRLLAELLERGTPLLGVCLGAQLLAEAAGGIAHRAERPEIGWHPVELTPEGARDPVVGPLAPAFEAFGWHSYESTLPPGATALAHSEVCLQAYRLDGSAWGIQFHAEVDAPTVADWIEHYWNDEDAVRIGVDAEALGAATEERIGAWNQLGRGVCARFLEAAEAAG